MKKIMLLATVVAMSMVIAMPAQAQSRKEKKAAQKEQWEREQRQKAEEEELRHQMKMDSLRNAATPKVDKKAQLQEEAEMAALEAELEIAKLKAANAKKAIAKRMGQDLFTPCLEESFDKPGEYMAGLGIVENEDDRGSAASKANHNAVENIASRYIGAIKNGMSLYYKDVTPRSRNKAKENENEGNVEAVGMKVIEKYANIVCGPKFEEDDMGGYTCYVAIHVPLKNVVNETIDELGIIQTDADRQRFRDYMNQELEKQAQAAAAEKSELEKMREELK